MPSDDLRLIESEGRRFRDTALLDLTAPIPQYPGWTMADLVAHTGAILGRTTLVCRDLLSERPDSPRPAEGEDVIQWFDERLAEVIGVLDSSDRAVTVWGFGSAPSVGFWVTRMVIEVGVHRWDAQQALGEPEPLLEEVATTGLDEFPDMWLPRLDGVQSLLVVSSDVGRQWQFGPDDPSATVEGSVSDLYLRLMSRPSPVVLPQDWAEAVDGLAPPPR